MSKCRMTVEDLVGFLQSSLTELGEGAPVLICVENKIYDLEIQVNPKGNLGPGSILILTVPVK